MELKFHFQMIFFIFLLFSVCSCIRSDFDNSGLVSVPNNLQNQTCTSGTLDASNIVYCPDGTWAYGFAVVTADTPYLYGVLNILLDCRNQTYDPVSQMLSSASSQIVQYNNLGTLSVLAHNTSNYAYCNGDNGRDFIRGYDLRMWCPSGPSFHPTGVCEITMRCSYNVSSNISTTFITNQSTASFTGYSSCGPGYVACGYEMKYNNNPSGGYFYGMTDLTFQCCKICEVAASLYFTPAKICDFCDPNCKQCSIASTNCTVCFDGYTLTSSNICSSISSNTTVAYDFFSSYSLDSTWSRSTSNDLSLTCTPFYFIGGYNGLGKDDWLKKTLSLSGHHSLVLVRFYFFKLGNWTGNLTVSIDNVIQITTSWAILASPIYYSCGTNPLYTLQNVGLIEGIFVHNASNITVFISTTMNVTGYWAISRFSIILYNCDSSCSSCTGILPNQCSSCANGTYFNTTSTSCSSKCNLSTYGDPTTNMCVSTCPSKYYKDPVSMTCVLNCQINYYANSEDMTCYSVCPNGTYGNPLNGTCGTTCPNDMYGVGSPYFLCYYCDFNCGSCNTSPTNCSTCSYPWLSSLYGTTSNCINPTYALIIENNLWNSTTLTQSDITSTNWIVSNSNSLNYNTSCGNYSLVGGNGVFGANAAMSRNYSGLPAHAFARVTFYAFKIGNWTNNNLTLILDSSTTLQMQTFSSTTDSLAYCLCGPTGFSNALRQFDSYFLHTSSTMNLSITSDLTLNSSQASWGIFNFSMTIFTCDSTCLTCYAAGDPNKCSSCSAGKFITIGFSCSATCGSSLYGDPTTNTCVSTCPSNYYQDNKTMTCVLNCNFNCNNCPILGCQVFCSINNTCQQCNNGYILFNNTCLNSCPNGYYFNGTNCLACSENCDACNSTGCIVCANPYLLKDSICVSDCGANYRSATVNISESATTLECVLCPDGCLLCDDNNKCTVCVSSNYFIFENGSCLPNCSKTNYFANTSMVNFTISGTSYPNYTNTYCNNCSSNCESCSNFSTNCTTCPLGRYLRESSTNNYICTPSCPINNGYYIQIVNGNVYCLKCSVNCQICDTGSDCLSCYNGFYLTPSENCSTKCPQYYQPDSNGVCRTCDSKLYIYPFANNSYDCVNCTAPGTFVYEDNNAPVGLCKNCTSYCTICFNENSCQTCEYGYTKDPFTQLCNPTCSDGYYFNNNSGSCNTCDTAAFCKTCQNNAENCTSCLSHHFLVSSADNTLSICSQCDNSCLECNMSSTNCTSCANETFLVNNECIQKICPQNCSDCLIENMTSCTACKYDFLLISNSCIAITCSENCSTCLNTNFSVCTVCNSGFMLYQGNCYAKCPSGTYISNDGLSCIACSNSLCSTCNSSGSCLTCQNGFHLISGTCIKSCSENTYMNASTGECLACSDQCNSCYGPQSNNCLTCKYPSTLKGTVCNSPCDQNSTCNISSPNYTIGYVKSVYVPSSFYIVFSNAINIPDYVNLNQLINISITGVASTQFTYTIQQVPNQQNSLMVTINTLGSLSKPQIVVNFTNSSVDYIRGTYNASVVTINNSLGNITLGSIIISSESPETQQTKENITYGTFVSFSYVLLSFCIITYLFDTKRMSFYWKMTDFMQAISLIIFFNLNYDVRFVTFLELIFVYHANFLAFLGKSVDQTTGQVSYFGQVIKSSFATEQYAQTFTRFLGTKAFIANGFNAIFLILALNAFILILKYYLKLHKKLFNSEEAVGLYGMLQYLYEFTLFSILIRAVQFFFYLIATSVFIQFYSVDFTDNYNAFGIATSVFSLVYYLCFFSWLSRKIINNPEVYEYEEERWKYDVVFHAIETKTFFQRNHFIFVHIKKFLIVICIATILQNINVLLSFLLVIQLFASIRYLKWRPFNSISMNILNFLTEIAFFVIICVLLKVSEITSNQQNGSTTISDDSVNALSQAGDVIISFTFIVLVLYSIVAGVLLLYYVVKNIECLCFVFFNQKLPEEDQTVIESFEEQQRKKQSSSHDDDSYKYKIPKRKDLREIAEHEEQRKKDLEAYKKDHIVKVG